MIRAQCADVGRRWPGSFHSVVVPSRKQLLGARTEQRACYHGCCSSLCSGSLIGRAAPLPRAVYGVVQRGSGTGIPGQVSSIIAKKASAEWKP